MVAWLRESISTFWGKGSVGSCSCGVLVPWEVRFAAACPVSCARAQGPGRWLLQHLGALGGLELPSPQRGAWRGLGFAPAAPSPPLSSLL